MYERLYDNAAVSTWPVDAARPDWDLIISHIFKRLPKGGRVLDFGCYTGGLLARLPNIYERYGVEINRAAASIAADKQLVQGWRSIDDIPPQIRFDVVIASDVIEHMSNPGHLIDRLFSLLADGGCVIVTTGDADNSLWDRFGANWWYCYYPEHISFISKAWLEHFSDTRGMSIEHCDKFRYHKLSFAQLVFGTILTYAYGRGPSTYVYVCNMLRSVLGRKSLTSVPGNGISADHLFIVMSQHGMRA